MSSRAALLLLVLAVGMVGPASAAAAAPRLAIVSLSASPRELRAGATVTLHGRVANRGRRSTTALVGLSLRTTPRARRGEALGGARLVRLRAGTSRTFSVRVRPPQRLFAASTTRRRFLTACVRPRRGAAARCRSSARRVTLRPSGAPTALGSPATPVTHDGPGSGDAPGPGPAPPGFRPGARSAGDVLFPAIGNGGYDAEHYDLAVGYVPSTKRLDGRTTLTARATQDLSELSLDLQGLEVSKVTVDGAPARFAREDTKLIVTPAAGIPAGRAFTVEVEYGGTVHAITDPDGSQEGWVPSADGAFVVGEPVGAQGWFPNNNTPADKATYDVSVTVPEGLEVLGNGDLVSQGPPTGGRTTWHWREGAPMASYLVTASVGQFDLTTDATSDPLRPFHLGIDSGYSLAQKTTITRDQQRVPAILAYFESLYGPYPFSTAGGIVDRSSVGYSLETQSKPSYPGTVPIDTVAHENAHQWFGDSVSPRVWSDIWLNEGLTEFSSWLWQEREDGGQPTPLRFTANYESPTMTWSVPPAAPATAAAIFDNDAMYVRGAMVCEALRQILGEETFLSIMRAWATERRHGNGTTADYIALVKRMGGKDPARLDAFFRQWLYVGERPTITPASF